MYKFLTLITLILTPVLVFAISNVQDLLVAVLTLINLVIPVVFGLALIVFFYGVAKFVFKSREGDEDAIKEGKSLMLWGVISIFVMGSLWGVIYFIQYELGLETTPAPAVYNP
ncbi:MAG: hypothetical protein HQ402_03485 [Parcubacteria group bacterium]|nr:hypothetical protein [Parcubacteria group bacterium]